MLLEIVFLMLGAASAAQSTPLAGTWEGQWWWTNGVNQETHSYRLVFVRQTGRYTGRFWDLDAHPPKASKISQLQPRDDGPDVFRMNAGGFCWNFQVVDNQLKGFMNGGPCTAAGLGAAAQIFAVDAHRVTSSH